ncbi:glycosyltransferase family 25 protein [Pseudoalteromonas sp. JBTF-M23]|uniref:Glycosyltransferase family 25 protein n=1 Tax=Pseudoalteromonas caenipelagi TaxID=2726988 RepID=A0A849VBE4_9GAMM|nr:glycosyltransferase family 25 protein [Pseudoalteromonas caenipelagi]NOU50178.1 glycosyltransferase family 25 protein [Pseudoalteromonas caenipelagi]
MKEQPPIYLINLDQSPERLEKSSARLKEQNINFERISGVYGKTLSDIDLIKNYQPLLNRRLFYRPLSKGEIGCYMSHRKAWQAIVDNKHPYAIVMEDDFRLVGDLHNVFATIEQLPVKWQLIKLAAYENRTRPIAFSHRVNDTFNLVVHKKAMTGCCAQAISYEGAKALLAATEYFARPVDTDLQHVWETKVPVYSLMPYYIEQDLDFDSDISAASGTKKVKKRFWKRKWLQFLEKIANKKATSQIIDTLQAQLKK